MRSEGESASGGRDEPGASRVPGTVSGPGDPGKPGGPGSRGQDEAGLSEPGEPQARLPVLPGFSEMALRRMSADRSRLVRELAARRQEAGLSQTDVAARMGTSQSAVARLESGEADARASTLERYAAAIGSQITWNYRADRRSDPMTIPIAERFPGEPPFRPGRPDHPGQPSWPSPVPGPQPVPSPQPLTVPVRVWPGAGEWPGGLYERLLEQRIVMAHGHLDDEAATRLSAQLLTLDAEGDDPIRFELQNLTAGLAAALTVMGVLDVVGVPVRARAGGQISGPALGVLAACTDRRAYPNAMFEMSEPAVEFDGRVTALAAREEQVSQMLDTLYFRLADVTGREVDEIRDDARRNRVLTAEEAIGYGLITGSASTAR